MARLPGPTAFQRGEPIDRNPQTQGFEVRLTYQTRAWGTLRLEISGPDLSDREFELLPAISLQDFQLTGPTEIACLPLRYQIAQKLHALTEQPPARENRRFRDLVDLLLLRELIDDLSSLRDACEATFAHRATHPWPPQLAIPSDSWDAGYTQLATEVGLDRTDINHAITEIQHLISEIARG